MAVGWRRTSPGARLARVTSLETRLGQPLKASYRAFLLANDGGEPEDNVFSVPGGANESGVNAYLSIAEVERELDMPEGLPAGLVPVAYAEGGNLVAIAVADGRVFFWDHEDDSPDGLCELAPSRNEFLTALRPFDTSEVTLKPGQVRACGLTPIF